MKMLLYIFFCLWIVAGTNIHENISLKRPSETNGVVLLSFLGDKLPFTIFGSMVDHIDTEIMHMTMEYAALQIHIDGCVMVDQVSVAPR